MGWPERKSPRGVMGGEKERGRNREVHTSTWLQQSWGGKVKRKTLPCKMKFSERGEKRGRGFLQEKEKSSNAFQDGGKRGGKHKRKDVAGVCSPGRGEGEKKAGAVRIKIFLLRFKERGGGGGKAGFHQLASFLKSVMQEGRKKKKKFHPSRRMEKEKRKRWLMSRAG